MIEIDDAGFEFPNEESKWIWISGIIDAESSLEMARSKSRTKRGYRWIPRMACSSTTIALLLQLKRASNPYGNISSHHHQDKRDGKWNKVSKFTLFSNGLRYILPKVLPYLVVKKVQATLLLRVLELLTKGPKPSEVESELESIWLQIRGLNKKVKI